MARQDEQLADGAQMGRGAAEPGRTKTVLLVEDDSLLAATIEDFLRADGYSVVTAPDGEAALLRARADMSAIDVLLTDLRMPRLDGTALILALRARRPDLPVVVMSGNVPHGWLALIERELNGHSLPHLVTKPMSFEQLRTALREACASAPGGG